MLSFLSIAHLEGLELLTIPKTPEEPLFEECTTQDNSLQYVSLSVCIYTMSLIRYSLQDTTPVLTASWVSDLFIMSVGQPVVLIQLLRKSCCFNKKPYVVQKCAFCLSFQWVEKSCNKLPNL